MIETISKKLLPALYIINCNGYIQAVYKEHTGVCVSHRDSSEDCSQVVLLPSLAGERSTSFPSLLGTATYLVESICRTIRYVLSVPILHRVMKSQDHESRVNL